MPLAFVSGSRYALAAGGYKSGTTHSAESLQAIQFAAGALPAIMTVLAIVVMAKYKLTDAFHAQILGEIKARRALEASGSEPFGAEAGSATPVERAASELAS